MASQKYTTLAQSTLASAYTAGDTSLVLASGEGALFPSGGDFYVAIDSPPSFILKATARSTDTLTVVNTAAFGSTANRGIGATVTLVIDSNALDGIRADLSQLGAYASLPSTSEAHKGDVYRCTDSPYEFIFDGSAWQPMLPGFLAQPTVPPGTGSLTWVNQGSATADSTKGYLTLASPADANNSNKMLVKSAPSAPYKFTVACLPTLLDVNYPSVGIAMRESGTGKLYLHHVSFELAIAGKFHVLVDKYTDPTTFSANPASFQVPSGNP